MDEYQLEQSTTESTVDIERCDSPSEWNQFVTGEDAPVFTRWEWGEVCRGYGHSSVYLGAYDDGRLIGALPLVLMRSRLFGDKLVSMPFAEYGSVVVGTSQDDKEVERKLLDRTTELADEFGVDFVSLRGRPLVNHPAYTQKRRWVTFRIPVGEGEDAVWDALDSSRRGHVRQGRDNDITIRVGDTLDDLRDFYRLYLQTMRGHGSPPHSFRYVKRLWNALADEGHMRLYLAEHDGRPINGIIDFPFGDTVYHWAEVSDYDYRDLDGGSLLLWNAIEWSAAEGYETFDMGRTREGTGVYMYKKSFGGTKTWMDDSHHFPNGEFELPNPDDEGYDAAKKAWRRLPLAVTRIVGPRIRQRISL